MKEEFKAFVRKRPELANFVNRGEMTWQKFFEQWSLYGEDEKVWEKYVSKEDKVTQTENKEESFNLGSLTNMIKKVDMDSVKKGINSMQKAVELLQGLVTSKPSTTSSGTGYSPRQLFKKFED